MTLKKIKITKYITSDGKEFVGGERRKDAADHEKFIQNRLKEHQDELKIAKILGEEDLFSEWEAHEIMNGEMDVEADFNDVMNRLFKFALCANDIENFREMAAMLRNVIDDLGGFPVIKKLYEYARQNDLN